MEVGGVHCILVVCLLMSSLSNNGFLQISSSATVPSCGFLLLLTPVTPFMCRLLHLTSDFTVVHTVLVSNDVDETITAIMLQIRVSLDKCTERDEAFDSIVSSVASSLLLSSSPRLLSSHVTVCTFYSCSFYDTFVYSAAA